MKKEEKIGNKNRKEETKKKEMQNIGNKKQERLRDKKKK